MSLRENLQATRINRMKRRIREAWDERQKTVCTNPQCPIHSKDGLGFLRAIFGDELPDPTAAPPTGTPKH